MPALAQTISTVSPSSAAQGTTNLTVTFTLPTSPPAPPTAVVPTSVTIGSMSGSSIAHPSQYSVTAVFSIPACQATGSYDCTIVFPSPAPTFTKSGGFSVTSGSGCTSPPSITSQPLSQTVSVGEPVAFSVTASGSATLGYQWQKGTTNISGATSASHSIASLAAGDAGSYRCVVTNSYGTATSDPATLTVDASLQVTKASFPVPDTGQTACYNATAAIGCPSAGAAFYGQDAQFTGYAPRFVRSADGKTVYDAVTRLTWQATPDTDGNGTINASDKMTYTQAVARPAVLNAAAYGGFTDWRLPTIKEQYSLIDFRGTDPSGLSGTDTSGLTPFLDRTAFDFAYGDTASGERIIDSQYASSTLYVFNPSDSGYSKDFGVNFADGRIKGYDTTMPGGSTKTFFVTCVRGNASYGANAFVDNGDQTITDRATGLMWAKADSLTTMNWQDALAFAQAKNAASWLGYSDWRLPNVKELQSLLDYTRSPDTSASAAINPLFTVTSFQGEKCSTDYPWYWSSTTHAAWNGSGATGAYVCFGRCTGYMSGWYDVHGAGSQRSDPKSGSTSSYTYSACGYYNSVAPQGDAVRITNYVRLVRGGAGPLRASFTWSPSSPTTAGPVTFSGSASGGTSAYGFSWNLDGTAATGASPTKSFSAGTHLIVLTVTDAAGLVTTLTQSITVTPVTLPPPPVGDGKLAGSAATFRKSTSVAGELDVTWSVSPCATAKAVILAGTLGSFGGYGACATTDAGSSGSTTIAAVGFTNSWFNVIWASGGTAGHPGYGLGATGDVEETWLAAGFCGLTADDHSDTSCN